ncbi:MAG: hypothetical protein ACRC26_11515 [Bacteroidales bacterium]
MEGNKSVINQFVIDLILSDDIRETIATHLDKQWFEAKTKVCDSDLYVIEHRSIYYFRFKKSKRFSFSTYKIPDDLGCDIQEEVDELKSSIFEIDDLRKAINAILKPIVKELLERKEQLRIAGIRAKEERDRLVKAAYDTYMESPLHWRDDKLRNEIDVAKLKDVIDVKMSHNDFFDIMFKKSSLISGQYDGGRNEANIIRRGDIYILYSDYYGSCSHCDPLYGQDYDKALAFCKTVANDALCFKNIEDIVKFLSIIKNYRGVYYRFGNSSGELIDKLLKDIESIGHGEIN